MDNYKAQILGIQNRDNARSRYQMANRRDNKVEFARNSGKTGFMDVNSKSKEGNTSTIFYDGPESEKLNGLKLEDRKRQRSEAHDVMQTVNQGETTPKDSVLSNDDCTETSLNYLATLTRQASQLQ